jgi:hypothetical protein
VRPARPPTAGPQLEHLKLGCLTNGALQTITLARLRRDAAFGGPRAASPAGSAYVILSHLRRLIRSDILVGYRESTRPEARRRPSAGPRPRARRQVRPPPSLGVSAHGHLFELLRGFPTIKRSARQRRILLHWTACRLGRLLRPADDGSRL